MSQNVTDWILKSRGSNKHVDPGLGEHPAILSESVLIAARTQLQLDEALTKSGDDYPTMDDFTAIGLVQSATIQQQKNLSQLWEIASSQSYFLPGRNNIAANLSRVLIDGQSLIRALYGGMELDIGDAGFSGNFIINLASKFLDNPFDLLFLLFNYNLEPMGGFYLEDAYVYQHQMALSAQQTMVIENIGLMASRIVSMSVS